MGKRLRGSRGRTSRFRRWRSRLWRARTVGVAMEPKTKADQERMGDSLTRLVEEDPTFKARYDKETGQTIISGMGELHLEIIVDRMLRGFNVDAYVGRPG